MLVRIRQIKALALEMRNTTSTNDDRHEKLRGIVDLCDEMIEHCIDDGR